VITKHLRRRKIVHSVTGIVIIHRDFFENDASLILDIFTIQQSISHDVTYNIDRQREILRKNSGVKAGVLLRSEGIHFPTHGVHDGGDFPGSSAPSALEKQVF